MAARATAGLQGVRANIRQGRVALDLADRQYRSAVVAQLIPRLTSTTSSLWRTSASETGVSCQMMTAITAIRHHRPLGPLCSGAVCRSCSGAALLSRSCSLLCSLSCSIVLVEEDRSPSSIRWSPFVGYSVGCVRWIMPASPCAHAISPEP